MLNKNDFAVELTNLFNAIAGRGAYDPQFYTLIHDYVALVKKAREVSQPLYNLFVGKEAIFDHQVAEIEKEQEYYDEAQRHDSLADAHFHNFTPQYDQLVAIHDAIEKSERASINFALKDKEHSQSKEILSIVHPEIIEALSRGDLAEGIFFNPKAGVGYAKGKRFKIKDDQPEFDVFGKLYAQINEPLARSDVLRIGKFLASNHQQETEDINNLAKKIRKVTKLDLTDLVQNNGNLTLVGNRLRKIPK